MSESDSPPAEEMAPDPPPRADDKSDQGKEGGPEQGKDGAAESESESDGGGGQDRQQAFRNSRPGAIQDRADTRRDAESTFAYAEVYADAAIGRDQHNYFLSAEGRAARVTRMPEVERRECVDGFVDPEGFAELVRRVASDRVVILQAEESQGRYAAARRLLILDNRPLHLVNPAIDLGKLTAGDLRRRGGYVCRDLSAEAAVDDYRLSSLRRVLEECDARLIITIDKKQAFDDSQVGGLVHELGRVADRRQILQHHLNRRLGAVADHILADDDVAALVERELGGPGAPVYARIIADKLYAAHRAGLPYARTVDQALRSRDGDQLRKWFEGLGSLSLQCMAVATAVLGGEPYETVALAAMELKRRLETPNPRNDSRPELDAPLKPTKHIWLRELGAETVPSTQRARHGTSTPTEVIRYRDENLQSQVLLHFWSEFDEARVALLDWLRWCAAHPLESVRIRTAVATGVLSVKGFDLVRALVIEPWTREDEPMFQLVAAEALSRTARHAGLREAVRDLLGFWSESVASELRATAARSWWRLEYATGRSAAAFDRLEEYVRDDDPKVVGAVCDSVAELWEMEWEGLDAPARLLKWISTGKDDQKYTAMMAFLVSAIGLVKRLPGESCTWPGLLHISAVDETRRREIAALWRAVLNDPELSKLAYEVLLEWACRADGVPLLRRSLARLMWETAVADGMTARRIQYAARSWADKERKRTAKNSSAEVLKIFQGR